MALLHLLVSFIAMILTSAVMVIAGDFSLGMPLLVFVYIIVYAGPLIARFARLKGWEQCMSDWVTINDIDIVESGGFTGNMLNLRLKAGWLIIIDGNEKLLEFRAGSFWTGGYSGKLEVKTNSGWEAI